MPIYGFQFRDGPEQFASQIKSVGWEYHTSDYDWDGLKRTNDNSYLFQYTLSGWGKLRVGNQIFQVNSGQAFFVRIASDHRYYLPEDSDGWEVLFIVLRGNEAESCWNVQGTSGSLFSFPMECSLIRLLKHIYQEAHLKQIKNGYKAAALSYQFLMEFYQSNLPSKPDYPEIILKSIQLMDEKFTELNGPEDLSRQLGVSKFRLIKQFHKTTGISTVDYLTRVRLEKAMDLLRNTNMNLDEIANLIGYSNGNYFNKVFRMKIGTSPGRFRKNKSEPPIDHITFN